MPAPAEQYVCDTVRVDAEGVEHPCGTALFDTRSYPDEWDRNTAFFDGVEMIVEYHIGILCGACGEQTIISCTPVDGPDPFGGH